MLRYDKFFVCAQRHPNASLVQVVPKRALRQPGVVGILQALVGGAPHLGIVPAMLVHARAIEKAGPDEAEEPWWLVAHASPSATLAQRRDIGQIDLSPAAVRRR